MLYGIKLLIRSKFRIKWDKEMPIKVAREMRAKSVDFQEIIMLLLIEIVRTKTRQAAEEVSIMNIRQRPME